MHVMFVSACTKRAVKRTRAILDRYATRMSDTTWGTPVTAEGLSTIRALLRAGASRNTSVACFENEGSRGMGLAWVVGVRERFDEAGRAPVFMTHIPVRVRAEDKQSWVLVAKKIAAISGLFHDLGKNNEFFAQKLLALFPMADPVRHEWISARLVEIFMRAAELTMEQMWDEAMRIIHSAHAQPIQLKDGVISAARTIFANVATHHRLFSEKKHTLMLDDTTFRNTPPIPLAIPRVVKRGKENTLVLDPLLNRKMQGPYGPELEADIRKASRDVLQLDAEVKPPLYWRAMTMYTRPALLLADYLVSSVRYEHPTGMRPADAAGATGMVPYANSTKGSKGKPQYNQPLSWHLQGVGKGAAAMVDHLLRLPADLPGLSIEAVTSIGATATGRFAWQQRAAEEITRARAEHPDAPMLLLVPAGTGSGKTRACARMACSAALKEKVRFATVLNLRTLTLQTGEAYANQLKVPPDEMAVVIGDAMARQAYESQKNADVQNADGMDTNLGEDITIQGAMDALPEWLDHFVKGNPNLSTMIGTPVFVSTADYLVLAGEPNQQARHIMPLLRLLSSDLILDEIDSYDAKSAAAMLRLVQLAGLFGRNVVAASATLTGALAKNLYKMFAHGAAMRAALHDWKEPDFLHGILCDDTVPTLAPATNVAAFMHDLSRQTQAMAVALGTKPAMRIPMLARIAHAPGERPTMKAFLAAATDSVKLMHQNNAWGDPVTGKPLSVGLVRVATIKMARKVARHLRKSLREFQPKVVCYHSRMFNGARVILEQELDTMLSRGSDPNQPARHPSVRAHMDSAATATGLFIVVATPVAEVGRDHDYDWAVIEPSSTYSIVQTAGRVRRHRTDPPHAANVGILQFNSRYCAGKSVVFAYPGNETSEYPCPAGHDMATLIDWDVLQHGLDARLRFDVETHKFAAFDEQAMVNALRLPLLRLTGERPDGSTEESGLWLSDFTYRNWPLRENNVTDTWRYNPAAETFQVKLQVEGKSRFVAPPNAQAIVTRDFPLTDAHWLCPSVEEILEICEHRGIDTAWAMEFSIPVYNLESPDPICWTPDGFGRD